MTKGLYYYSQAKRSRVLERERESVGFVENYYPFTNVVAIINIYTLNISHSILFYFLLQKLLFIVSFIIIIITFFFCLQHLRLVVLLKFKYV